MGLFWARPPALSRPAALHELEIICTPTLELVLLPQKHQPLGSANHQHANQPPLQRAGKTSFPHLKKPLPHSPIFLLPTQLTDPQLYLAALLPAPGCLPSQCHSLPQLRSAPFLPHLHLGGSWCPLATPCLTPSPVLYWLTWVYVILLMIMSAVKGSRGDICSSDWYLPVKRGHSTPRCCEGGRAWPGTGRVGNWVSSGGLSEP